MTGLPFHGKRLAWDSVYSIAHVLIHVHLDQAQMNTHDIFAYLFFLKQHRVWTPMLLVSDEQFVLSITTWESQRFSINLNLDHPQELVIFLRVLIGLMFLDDNAVGLEVDLGRAEGSFDAVKWDQHKLRLRKRRRVSSED